MRNKHQKLFLKIEMKTFAAMLLTLLGPLLVTLSLASATTQDADFFYYIQ